jgi:hypothetical protein
MTTVKTDIGARDDAYRTKFSPSVDIAATDVQRAIELIAGAAAPSDAEYLLGATDANLPNGRIPTDTATVSWDFATVNQAQASLITDSVDNTFLANMAAATVKGRASGAGTGDPVDLTEAQLKAILSFPTSTTDNTVPRFDGTTGNLQTSGLTIDDSDFLDGVAGIGVGGATADATNRLSANTPAVLFNRETDNIQVKLNKQATGDTASFLFQTGFSGRAEIGTVGDDNFVFKTSPDGSVFTTGIQIAAADGIVTIPTDMRVTTAGTNSASAVTVGGTQTLTNKTLTSPTISGGTINNAVIGGTTPAAATVTTLTTTGDIELGNASDTTLTRSSAGNVTIEGNLVYRAGGTDVPVTDGGTGASTAQAAVTNLITPLTQVSAATGDLIAVADVSDSNNGKKVAASTVGAGKQTIWIPASALSLRTGDPGPSRAQFSISATVVDYLAYDPTSIEDAFFSFVMPKSWNVSNITARVHWFHSATTTNFAVVWNVFLIAYGDGESIAGTPFGGSGNIVDTGGSANTLYISSESSAFAIGSSPAAQNYMNGIVRRNGSDGSDTLAVDALLLGVEIYYTTNANTDD